MLNRGPRALSKEDEEEEEEDEDEDENKETVGENVLLEKRATEAFQVGRTGIF